MSENRAQKSGYALEAAQKVHKKYDNDRGLIALQWVSSQVGIPLPDGYDGNAMATHQLLKDGMVLAKLANVVEANTVKASLLNKVPTMAFKQMELINLFLAMMVSKKYVTETEIFQTVDLFENQNMNAVVITIEALGRHLMTLGRPGFGKAESVGEKREWTEQQLREGQNIIGLQMGTNKGANQSGLNMGKTRAIVD